jgi:hypothetical protein
MRTLFKVIVLACLLAYLSGVPLLHVVSHQMAQALRTMFG